MKVEGPMNYPQTVHPLVFRNGKRVIELIGRSDQLQKLETLALIFVSALDGEGARVGYLRQGRYIQIMMDKNDVEANFERICAIANNLARQQGEILDLEAMGLKDQENK